MTQVNKELQSQREHQDLKLSRQHEETNNLRANFETQLLAKQSEIHELEDMKNQLTTKEKIEEKLVSEEEELMLRLNKVQHQLANLQSQVGGCGTLGVAAMETVDNGETVGEARGELLEKELREQISQCHYLKTRYVNSSYMYFMHTCIYSVHGPCYSEYGPCTGFSTQLCSIPLSFPC